VNLNASAVECGVCSVDANEGRETVYRGILQNHVRQSLLALRHGGERNVLRGLGNAEDDSRVLHREEALGHVNVEKDGGDECGESDQQSRGAILQDEAKRASVKRNGGIEPALGGMVKAALLGFVFVLEQLRG